MGDFEGSCGRGRMSVGPGILDNAVYGLRWEKRVTIGAEGLSRYIAHE